MKNFEKYVELRKTLHTYAELSNEEHLTKKILLNFFDEFTLYQKTPLANDKAFALTFDSQLDGPHIAFRADLDALPLNERVSTSYTSITPNVSHKCGHDGHMACVASLAEYWKKSPRKRGKLTLLFQHAEETGEGANEIIKDKEFRKLKIDAIYGFHNLPGYKEGKIYYSENAFACASTGLHISIGGKTSHAAEPEKANTCIDILPNILKFTKKLNHSSKDSDFLICTPVQIQIGDENYGITPGDGVFSFTIRCICEEKLDKAVLKIQEEIRKLCKANKLRPKFELKEKFPALINSTNLAEKFIKLIKKEKLEARKMSFPLLWSEDFGHYAKATEVFYIGVGLGKDQHPLHDQSYDFNDNIIEGVNNIFSKILESHWSLTK